MMRIRVCKAFRYIIFGFKSVDSIKLSDECDLLILRVVCSLWRPFAQFTTIHLGFHQLLKSRQRLMLPPSFSESDVSLIIIK